MMAISSTQYVWTLFTGPFTTHLGATLAQVQVTISILIVLQTFLSPFKDIWLICSDRARCYRLGRYFQPRAGFWPQR